RIAFEGTYPASWRAQQAFRRRGGGTLAGGERQPCEEAAEILALLEVDASTVDFGDVADDGEAEPGSGFARGVEPRPALEQFAAPFLGDSGAVVLDQDIDLVALGLDRDEHSAA